MTTTLGRSLLLLLLPALGCSAPPPAWVPCEQCRTEYRFVARRRTERTIHCVVDGKTVDCRKNPTACPDCARLNPERK